MRSVPCRWLGDRSLYFRWGSAKEKCGRFFGRGEEESKEVGERERETHFDGDGHSHRLVDLQKKDSAEVSRTDFRLERLQLISSDGHWCAVVVEGGRALINCGTEIETLKTMESVYADRSD